jgi:hypothetical protein
VQQPRRIAGPRGMLCDAVGRQVEKKVAGEQGVRPARARAGAPRARREC